MAWPEPTSLRSNEMSIYSPSDTERSSISEEQLESAAAHDAYTVDKLEATRTATATAIAKKVQKKRAAEEAAANAAVKKALARKALARKAASKAMQRKNAEHAAALQKSPGYDALTALLHLDNPDAKELYQHAISCIKKLRGQRDYELERQEHAKLLTRRIIDDSQRQANDYRSRCLKVRKANNILRAAKGLPLKDSNFDNDDDDEDDDDSDQQSDYTLQDLMEL